MTPRSATHDPVVLAIEATLASIVQVLTINGQGRAAALVTRVAGRDGYVASVAAEARLDATHGGRGARIAHIIGSASPATEP